MKVRKFGGDSNDQNELANTAGQNTHNKTIDAVKGASKQDPSMFLTKEEFCNIQFEREWPLIVKDLAQYLTNMDLLKGTRISEQDEYTGQNTHREFFKEMDISPYKTLKLTHDQYLLIVNTFRAFQG